MIDKSLPTCALFIGPDRRIVIYPCRDQKLLNIVATLPDDLLREEVHDSYTGPGTLEHMRKTYESFHPDIKLIMEYSPCHCANIVTLMSVRYGSYEIMTFRWKDGLKGG
jgi:salicylate hydroxylase